jgi:hypothetical protein
MRRTVDEAGLIELLQAAPHLCGLAALLLQLSRLLGQLLLECALWQQQAGHVGLACCPSQQRVE